MFLYVCFYFEGLSLFCLLEILRALSNYFTQITLYLYYTIYSCSFILFVTLLKNVFIVNKLILINIANFVLLATRAALYLVRISFTLPWVNILCESYGRNFGRRCTNNWTIEQRSHCCVKTVFLSMFYPFSCSFSQKHSYSRQLLLNINRSWGVNPWSFHTWKSYELQELQTASEASTISDTRY